jgi:hypothetical protein
VEKAQGSMESFVNVCKQRSSKNLLPNEWKTQWMVLYENKIVFFKSEYKEKHKTVIFHYTIRSVLALENRISNMSNWFEIVTKKYTYVLYAIHHRYKTEKLLYSWLVAIHNSLLQSNHDCRDPEAIRKVSLQIEYYNEKVCVKKHKEKVQREMRKITMITGSNSESDVQTLDSPTEGRGISQTTESAFRRVKTEANNSPDIANRQVARARNTVREKRRRANRLMPTQFKKEIEPTEQSEEKLEESESLISFTEEENPIVSPNPPAITVERPVTVPLCKMNSLPSMDQYCSEKRSSLKKDTCVKVGMLTQTSPRSRSKATPDKENIPPRSNQETEKEKGKTKDQGMRNKGYTSGKRLGPLARSVSVSDRRRRSKKIQPKNGNN